METTTTNPTGLRDQLMEDAAHTDANTCSESMETVAEHDNRNSSETNTTKMAGIKNETNGEPKDGEKRVRTWSFESTEEMEALKKIKVHDTGHEMEVIAISQRPRDQPCPSPVLVTNGWPQRSPIDSGHPRNGGEHRCRVDETHASSPSSRSRMENRLQEEHDEVANALFAESFDTISACPSAMEAAQEQTANEDGLLSPRQKAHTPTDEDGIGLLSPNDESRHGSRTSNQNRDTQSRYNPSLETREDMDMENNCRTQFENSPHSPPQRIVHVDGDENGCVDISPIKFSPPTEPSPSQHREYSQFTSTPTNNRHEQQKAAEVSFDNSTGYQSYHHEENHSREFKKSNSPLFSRKREGDEEDVRRRRSYSASTLSEAKTPPRRGTSRAHTAKETRYGNHGYDHIYATAPHFPRDVPYPYHAGSYYPHHPEVPNYHRDPSQVYQQVDSASLVRSDHSGRVGFASPIRPSQSSYRPTNVKQELGHHHYREPTPSEIPPPYSGGQWMGHVYSTESREYPPPRARLPPKSNNQYWNQNQNSQQQRQSQHHMRRPSTLSTQEIPTQGHPKDRRGTPLVPPATAARSGNHISPPVPQHYYHYEPMSSAALVPGLSPKDPFDLLRSVRKIFQGCSYLLYPAHMGVQWGDKHEILHSDPGDLKVARRRIESAICALGGYIKDIQKRDDSAYTSPSSSNLSQPAPPPSVFRRRMDYCYRDNTSIYRDRFHNRYFVGDHVVSWEVEENPPVLVSVDEDDNYQSRNVAGSRSSGTTRVQMQKISRRDNISKKGDTNHKQRREQTYNSDSFLVCQPITSHEATNPLHQQKMKYRCKLCGQPKQNHVCPYQKSLVRTLGIMVCPVPTSYMSAEPGVLTPPLSEMNNFVPYERRSDESSDLDTDVSSREQKSLSTYNVTPGGPRNQNDRYSRYHSPSSLSTSPHSDAQENQPPDRRNFYHIPQKERQQRMPTNLWQHQKPHLEYHQQQPLYMTLALRPEHYRAVTPRTPYRNGSSSSKVNDERDDREESGSYEYPHVPLTFMARKTLTDTLFHISQSIPSIIGDVASLLRMARERDEWDLAVAEVLTQVLVCSQCSEGDYRLDGLKTYLLKFGTAS